MDKVLPSCCEGRTDLPAICSRMLYGNSQMKEAFPIEIAYPPFGLSRSPQAFNSGIFWDVTIP